MIEYEAQVNTKECVICPNKNCTGERLNELGYQYVICPVREREWIKKVIKETEIEYNKNKNMPNNGQLFKSDDSLTYNGLLLRIDSLKLKGFLNTIDLCPNFSTT